MLKISRLIIVLGTLLYSGYASALQVNIGIAVPGVRIGFYLPAYPQLEVVPGYPVYYAPQLDANYFFYDGLYWLYLNDNWYASSWYDGPWGIVNPVDVPEFILRIPVRYYRRPPAYFRGWGYDAPPHWGEHWGRDWEQRRADWDRWDRRAAPPPAPLPDYQRRYSGDRYPRDVKQQQKLNRRYEQAHPNAPVLHPINQGQQGNPRLQGAPGYNPPPPPQQGGPRYNPPPVQQGPQQRTNPWLQNNPAYNPPPAARQTSPTAPRAQAPQQSSGNMQRSAPTQAPPQQKGATNENKGNQPPQAATQYKQPAQGSQGQTEKWQDKEAPHERKDGKGQEQDRNRDHKD